MKLWTPNQHLDNGRFIIQKVLGGGGFGLTYSAIEQPTAKLVVIKTLNHIQQSKEDFQQRQVKFVNEALRLARCSHTHIVQVYEVIQEDGLWGMVMEYIDGEDLGVYVEQHGQLSEDEALLFIDQVGQALEYVHKQGFLHRDVKPNNIILRCGKSEAVLIDFGLAREYTIGQVGSMTNDRTNGYAPIEQYERQGNFGHYTDVYALAATLYSLLTKEIPFPANFRDKGIPLPPPKQFNQQISDRVNNAIMKGMTLQPQERLQSVLEFRELLGIPSITPRKTLQKQGEKQLNLSVGIDYNRLHELLAAQKWKEADQETTRVILAVVQRENEGWLRMEDIDNFPCEDLCTIDQLWLKHSNGHFGFSVQKRIYQDLGGSREYNEKIWEAFGDRVGWRKDGWVYYTDFIFDLKAPEAHLPVCWLCRGGLGFFFSCVETCYFANPKSAIQNPKLAELDYIDLISVVGMDYTRLRDLLTAQKWKEADEETAHVILAVAGREKEGWLREEDIDNCPFEDLRTIDQLWVKHSNGHFGFSVQKHIYQSLGGVREYNREIWEAFGDRLGWRKNHRWMSYTGATYSLKAPVAHLPFWCVLVVVGLGGRCLGVSVWGSLLCRRDLYLPNPKSQLENLKADNIQIISAMGMDYTQLRNLLATQKWKDADKETTRVMLAVAKREKEGWLRVEDIDNFPCEDLRIIDKLWVKHSNGHFGFLVQKRIYQSLGGTREFKLQIWEAFSDRIGWRKDKEWMYYTDLTYDLKAPEGQLPVFVGEGGLGDGRRWIWGKVGKSTGGGGWSLLSRRDF